jgi:hypothetical protein
MCCNLCRRTTNIKDASVSDNCVGATNAGVIRVGNIKLLTRNVSPSGAMQAEATELRTLKPSVSKELKYSTNAEEYILTPGKKRHLAIAPALPRHEWLQGLP